MVGRYAERPCCKGTVQHTYSLRTQVNNCSMASGSGIPKFYLLIGGPLSLFYIAVGGALMSGKLSFGFDSSTQMTIGVVVLLYGLFRLYLFFVRYRRYRNGGE